MDAAEIIFAESSSPANELVISPSPGLLFIQVAIPKKAVT